MRKVAKYFAGFRCACATSLIAKQHFFAREFSRTLKQFDFILFIMILLALFLFVILFVISFNTMSCRQKGTTFVMMCVFVE